MQGSIKLKATGSICRKANGSICLCPGGYKVDFRPLGGNLITLLEGIDEWYWGYTRSRLWPTDTDFPLYWMADGDWSTPGTNAYFLDLLMDITLTIDGVTGERTLVIAAQGTRYAKGFTPAFKYASYLNTFTYASGNTFEFTVSPGSFVWA